MQGTEGIRAMVEELAEVHRRPVGSLPIATITAFSKVSAVCPLIQLQLRYRGCLVIVIRAPSATIAMVL